MKLPIFKYWISFEPILKSKNIRQLDLLISMPIGIFLFRHKSRVNRGGRNRASSMKVLMPDAIFAYLFTFDFYETYYT